MNKRTKRLIAGLAIAAGALGAAGAYLRKRNISIRRKPRKAPDVWARPGMLVAFRAELMPGRDRQDRSFRVTELLPSGRVLLQGVDGEHTATEFEQVEQSR